MSRSYTSSSPFVSIGVVGLLYLYERHKGRKKIIKKFARNKQ
jgi:hypothetical protein